MNVYRRYFEAKKGVLVDEVLSIIKIQEESKQKIKDVAKSIGANQESGLFAEARFAASFLSQMLIWVYTRALIMDASCQRKTQRLVKMFTQN